MNLVTISKVSDTENVIGCGGGDGVDVEECEEAVVDLWIKRILRWINVDWNFTLH